MKGRLQSYAFPREWKEPSGAGCYASLQTGTALGSVPHHPRVSSANKMVRRLQSGGLSLSPVLPLYRGSRFPRHCRGRGT